MFKRLYVDNYKCFVNFTLDIQELTLVAGNNGSGKTSVLDIMQALRELLSGRANIVDPRVFPPSSITAWQSGNIQTYELDAELDGDDLRYRLEVEHEINPSRSRILKESLTTSKGERLFQFQVGEVRLYLDDHSEGPVYSADWSESALARVPSRHDNVRLTSFLDAVRSILVCGLYPASFQQETTRHDETLDRDARNFSAWYQHIQLEAPGQVERFRRAIAEVIDGLDQIRLQKTGLNTRALMIDFVGDGRRYELALNEISDGQRALIALYALIHFSAGRGYTLFLDEPEKYVALSEIQPWLMELDERCGNDIPQALVCSHHPETINFLGAAHGVWLYRERAGMTKVCELSDSALKNDSGLTLSEIVARGWVA